MSGVHRAWGKNQGRIPGRTAASIPYSSSTRAIAVKIWAKKPKPDSRCSDSIAAIRCWHKSRPSLRILNDGGRSCWNTRGMVLALGVGHNWRDRYTTRGTLLGELYLGNFTRGTLLEELTLFEELYSRNFTRGTYFIRGTLLEELYSRNFTQGTLISASSVTCLYWERGPRSGNAPGMVFAVDVGNH